MSWFLIPHQQCQSIANWIANSLSAFITVNANWCAFSALTLLTGCQEELPACKNCVMKCWWGYLSEVRIRLFAFYGPADATAIPKLHQLLPHLNPRLVSPLRYRLTQIAVEKRLMDVVVVVIAVNAECCACVSWRKWFISKFSRLARSKLMGWVVSAQQHQFSFHLSQCMSASHCLRMLLLLMRMMMMMTMKTVDVWWPSCIFQFCTEF